MTSNAQDEEEEISTTVKFNVGGKLYEVSKTLLQGFPDTFLAEKASSSSSSPIFIDRDPDRFAFCLDYMRDNGTVHLAETVSKSAFLKDLKFFGFVNVDKTKICDEKSQHNCMNRSIEITEAIKCQISQMEKDLKRKTQEIAMQKMALKCRAHSAESTTDYFYVDYGDFHRVSHLHNDKYFQKCLDKLGLVATGNSISSEDHTALQVRIRLKINTIAKK